jgi:hypothetical protein
MKFTRALGFLMILGSSAVAAYSQTPIDPKVIIQGSDPACGGAGQPICYNGTPSPLVESFSSPMGFVYTGTPNLTSFFLEFTGVPLGTAFSCQTDIWVECAISFPSLSEVEFALTGGPGPCNFNDGIGGTCPGFLSTDQGASITFEPLISETPEPGSILLFGTGLISIFMAAKRRLRA